MPTEKKIMNGFDALAKLPSRTENSGFTRLNSLMRLIILPTPPDNRANIRFLSDDFSLIQTHPYVDVEGYEKKQTLLCQRTFDKSAKCILCEAKVPVRNSGICRVGLVDDNDEIIYDTFTDAKAEDYASYAEVMDDANITRNGDSLTLSNIPAVRLLVMGVKFWRDISMFNEKYGTICNRPYTVFRQGERLETTYTIAPGDKDENYKTPELLQMQWEPGLDFCMSVDDYIKFLSRPKLYEGFAARISKSKPENNSEPSLHDILK